MPLGLFGIRGVDKLDTCLFRTRNCTFKIWQLFLIPRANLGSLVANWKIVKFLKLCELIIVRVFLEGYLRVIGETGCLSWIKMISILPWLREMFRHWLASCSRHSSQMASFVRSRKNATNSVCIGCVVQAYSHFVFGSYIRRDNYLSSYVFGFWQNVLEKIILCLLQRQPQ